MKIKRTILIIFCTFVSIIAFFSLFGGMIRQNSYIAVTTTKVEMQYGDFAARRVVPNESVHEDMFGGNYVWVLAESDDIGEPYYYANKVSVQIFDRDEISAYVRPIFGNLSESEDVIVTAESELQEKTRVRITEGSG